VYDTILLAIGRYADTKKLNLEAAKIEYLENGKIVCKDDDSTNIPNVFAIGDCVQFRPELTPTAIMAG